MPEARQVADASHRSGVPATEEKDTRQGPKLPFKVVQQRTLALVDGGRADSSEVVGGIGSAEAKNFIWLDGLDRVDQAREHDNYSTVSTVR